MCRAMSGVVMILGVIMSVSGTYSQSKLKKETMSERAGPLEEAGGYGHHGWEPATPVMVWPCFGADVDEMMEVEDEGRG